MEARALGLEMNGRFRVGRDQATWEGVLGVEVEIARWIQVSGKENIGIRAISQRKADATAVELALRADLTRLSASGGLNPVVYDVGIPCHGIDIARNRRARRHQPRDPDAIAPALDPEHLINAITIGVAIGDQIAPGFQVAGAGPRLAGFVTPAPVQRLAGRFMPALGSCQCGTVDAPVATTINPIRRSGGDASLGDLEVERHGTPLGMVLELEGS